MIFLPFNQSWGLTHWRFPIDNTYIFWSHNIMPHLIDVEDTSGNLVSFSQNNAISLKLYVVSYDRLLFEHFLCLYIRWLISYHPRWSKFRSIADIYLLAFLYRHFSTQSDRVDCKPPIYSTNYCDWKSIFLVLLRRRFRWQRGNWFVWHSIESWNSHIFWSTILIKLVSVYWDRALFCLRSIGNWCRCLFIDVQSCNWGNTWFEKYFCACIKVVLILCNIVLSFA